MRNPFKGGPTPEDWDLLHLVEEAALTMGKLATLAISTRERLRKLEARVEKLEGETVNAEAGEEDEAVYDR